MKFVVLILGALVLVSGTAVAEVFGNQDVETTGWLTIEATQCWAPFFWYDATGYQIDSITLYIRNESVARNIRVALFEQIYGGAWALVDTAIEVNIPVDTGWVSFPMLNNAIIGDGCYRLQGWAQAGTGGIYLAYGSGGPATDSVTYSTFSGYDLYHWTSPLSTVTRYAYQFSAYATISIPVEGSTTARRRRILGGQ